MTDRYRCKYVKCKGPMPVTARADADFCCPQCKSAHHNEQRRSQGTTGKRLTPASAPVSGASADVHPLREAREQQEATDEDV